MSAGGSTKTQPGMGGQTAGRPMTPFSMGGMQQGGMQGFNSGTGGIMGAGDPFKQPQQMQGSGQQFSGYGMPGNLGQLASLIQGNGQMPQAMTPFSMSAMAPQYQSQVPQSMLPFQQSQGMAPQPPATQSPMQQGLGGLGAYMGGGG